MRAWCSLVWKSTIETALLVACLLLMTAFGTGYAWIHDNRPLFVEGPDSAASYVVGSPLRAGQLIVTHRQLRRTDDCSNRGGVWIVDKAHDAVIPLQQYTGVGRPTPDFVDSVAGFWLPLGISKGHYAMRTYLSCQRNPLSEITQQLRDLPFDIIE